MNVMCLRAEDGPELRELSVHQDGRGLWPQGWACGMSGALASQAGAWLRGPLTMDLPSPLLLRSQVPLNPLSPLSVVFTCLLVHLGDPVVLSQLY